MKDVILLGQITDKHAKVFDELKKEGSIGEVYIVPVLNKDALIDHFKLNNSDTNKDVMRNSFCDLMCSYCYCGIPSNFS